MRGRLSLERISSKTTLKGVEWQLATAVHMALVACSAEHRLVDVAPLELGWNWHTVLAAGDGVAHENFLAWPV